MIQLFTGLPGSGKSLAMQRMAIVHSLNGWPVFAYDSTKEWELVDKDGSPNWRWQGMPPFFHTVLPEYDGDFEKAYKTVSEMVSEFQPDSDGETPNGIFVFSAVKGWDADTIAKLTGAIGDAYFAHDEIDLFAEYKGFKSNPLREFLHRGRHTLNRERVPCEVHVMGAMRRPQNVHTDLTNLSTEVLVFRSQGEQTVDRLLREGWIKPEHESVVQTLPDLSFIRWNNTGTINKGRVLLPGERKK